MLEMRFDVTSPCKSCPFRRSGKLAVRLTLSRVNQIAGIMLEDGAGGTFGCHEVALGKTKGRRRRIPVHCAGALIFAEKHDCQTLPMQLAYRIGIINPEYPYRYIPRKFRTKRQRKLIFDTIEEMRATAWRR